MKFIGIIPARYASTRFPAKPLAVLGGKPVIQRVYEQVSGILDETYVATDDERIESAVKAFGGKVVMTSVHHKSGTDRCYEAYTKVGRGYDVVVNIQGDEPFIQKSQLEAVKACFEDPATQIATLVKPFIPDDGLEALENVNSPKVVVGKNMNALYFSRSIIPFQRNVEKEGWLKGHTYYKHIGLYAYRADVLKEITSLPQSSLELAESLEQLMDGSMPGTGCFQRFGGEGGGVNAGQNHPTANPPTKRIQYNPSRQEDDEERDAFEYHSCGNRGCCTFRSSDRRRTMESGTAVAGYVCQQDAA